MHALKLLLADDDKDDRELFAEALASLDPTVICEEAEDGQQALEFLANEQSDPPNLIFLDINMPVMNGWEVLKQMKRNSLYSRIPVIMYTTSSGERERRLATDLGALCLVTKPDDFRLVRNLQSIVIKALNEGWDGDVICSSINQLLHAS